MSTESKRIAIVRRENLKRWMEDQNVSPTELSEKLLVGKAYVSLLFNPSRFFGEKAARSIESKLGMQSGALDAEGGSKNISTSAWKDPVQIPPGMYGLLDQTRISPSKDAGMVDVDNSPLPALAFKGEWLRKSGATDRALLVMGEQVGDSMSPYIEDGDLYLVDAGQSKVVDGQVYALLYANELRLRRLSKRFDGGLILRADNARYPEEQLSPDQAVHIRVFGRVLWRAG